MYKAIKDARTQLWYVALSPSPCRVGTMTHDDAIAEAKRVNWLRNAENITDQIASAVEEQTAPLEVAVQKPEPSV